MCDRFTSSAFGLATLGVLSSIGAVDSARAAGMGSGFELVNSADARSASVIPSPDGINSSGARLLSRRDAPGAPAVIVNDGGPLEAASQSAVSDLLSPLLRIDNNAELLAFVERYDFDPDLEPNGSFKPTFAADDGPANAVVTGVAATDPFLATTIRVTNPFDEEINYRFETALNIGQLDHSTLVTEGAFSAEVIDTGGDPGAELTLNAGFSVRDIATQQQNVLVVDLFDSRTISEGERSTVVQPARPVRFGPSDPIDQVLSATFLTLTPGDTAVVTVIGSFGDEQTPLFDLAAIQESLGLVEAFAADLSIPEPSGGVLFVLGGLVAAFNQRLHGERHR